MDIKVDGDRIVHSPYESWIIHKNIEKEIKNWLKPGGKSGSKQVYFLQSIINIYAPGIFTSIIEWYDSDICVLDSLKNIFSHAKVQHIYLPGKIVYSLDNKTLCEFNKEDDPEPLLEEILKKSSEDISYEE